MYEYNPPLQPRALITYGVLAEQEDEATVVRLLTTLYKVECLPFPRDADCVTAERSVLLQLLDKFYDNIVLVKAVLMCLTRVVVVLPKDSCYPPLLFWVAVSFLQV